MKMANEYLWVPTKDLIFDDNYAEMKIYKMKNIFSKRHNYI